MCDAQIFYFLINDSFSIFCHFKNRLTKKSNKVFFCKKQFLLVWLENSREYVHSNRESEFPFCCWFCLTIAVRLITLGDISVTRMSSTCYSKWCHLPTLVALPLSKLLMPECMSTMPVIAVMQFTPWIDWILSNIFPGRVCIMHILTWACMYTNMPKHTLSHTGKYYMLIHARTCV